MGLILAGSNVVMPTDELKEWVYRNIDPNDAVQWSTRSWPGFGTVGMTWPTGFRDIIPNKIILNRLIWPQQAARWAYMFLIMDASMVNQIHDAAFGPDGMKYNPVQLVMDYIDQDGNGEQINTTVYLMPPTPLSWVSTSTPSVTPGSGLPPPANNSNDMYLISVVDERYWWWQIPFIPFDPPITDTTTWAALLGQINSSLVQYVTSTIMMDTVSADYLNASPAFTLPYEPVAPIIDALAMNVGMKFVRKFNGSCFIQNNTTAQTQTQADFNNKGNRVLRAGGDKFPTTTTYP